ncbi:hypothetical protein FSOLCH5_003565 [Fusarium solani]
MMNSSVKDWKVYLDKCFVYLSRWLKLLGEATVLLGRPYQDIQQIQDIMAEVGYSDVTVKYFRWPTNPWPKDAKHKALGQWHNVNIGSAIEALTLAPFTRALGWKDDEARAFAAHVRRDLNDRRIHAYWPIVSVYGQKPLS